MFSTDEKYVIIGVYKGGTTSLEEWMEINGYDVKRHELMFTNRYGPQKYKRKFSDRTPIIILRDPIERAYSHLNYFYSTHQWFGQELKWYDLLRMEIHHQYIGDMNPISCSNYSKWLKLWEKHNPIVLHLETVTEQFHKFPRKNVGMDKKPIDKVTKLQLEQLLAEECHKNQIIA